MKADKSGCFKSRCGWGGARGNTLSEERRGRLARPFLWCLYVAFVGRGRGSATGL
jgi:hypothetical protein